MAERESKYNEPWATYPYCSAGDIFDSNDDTVAECDIAEADRIVACVNFCAGFDSERLHDMTLA